MSGIRINYTIQDQPVRQLLAKLLRAGKNLQPAMKSIGEYLLRATEERFSQEQDPQGRPWTPLAAATRKRKKGPKILTESGRMRGSIVYRAFKDRVVVGTNVVYAAIHQLGGEISQEARTQTLAFGKKGFLSHKAARRRKKGAIKVRFAAMGARKFTIPARPFLGVNQEDIGVIKEILIDHLRQAIEK